MSFFGKGSLKDGKWYARKCDFPLEGGFGSGCKQAIGMATEKILPVLSTVEAEAVLLSSLSWKRFPSLVALLDGLKACFAAESLLHGSGSSGRSGGS